MFDGIILVIGSNLLDGIKGTVDKETPQILKIILLSIMKFLILPLLVAVNYLDHNDSAKQLGPEIIYNVTFNAEAIPSTNETQFLHIMASNLSSQLRCRYQKPDNFNCHLEKSKMILSYRNLTHTDTYVASTEAPDEYSRLTFSIKFNELGIEKLIVPTSIAPSSLDKIRYIINQFHTGMNLVGKPDGAYRVSENFTTGSCLTDFYVQLDDLMEHTNKEKTGKYKMWSPNNRVIIDKIRDLKNCKIAAPYFFESRESWLKEPKMSIKMESSKSRIIADHSTFISSTETTMTLSVLKNPTGELKLRENVTIIYDSVVPAKDNFPEIKNPACAGIVTGKWFYDDGDSEENSDQMEDKPDSDEFMK
ncbi:uncharacterized protein [Chelonus insularis]|uniref:uncharacterized protein n=1 Tax=Chelonus insularis TaxID=460826 RepID=UPI00158B6CE4|nr:uncharacterized protein LOC118067053 [Chelonus insularis]